MALGESANGAGLIGGLLQSLKGALASLIAIAQTRLEILSTELQEEITRAANLLLWASVALLASGIGLMLGALLLVLMFWDTHRVLVSVLVTGFFFSVAIIALLVLRNRLKGGHRPFDATITELSRDRDHLQR